MSDRTFYARTFSLVTLALLAYLLYQILLPFFAAIAWASFFAFLVHPIHTWLVRKWRGRASASAALLTIAVLLILIGPLTGLGAAFAAQVAELLRLAQDLAIDHQQSDLVDLPVIGRAADWLQEVFGITLPQIQAWAVEGARTVLKWLAGLGQKALLGALGTVVGFVLMMFILFFAIRDGRAVFSTLRALVPMSPEDRARLFAHLAAVTRAMVFGTGVTALVQGVLIAAAFAILGLPSPIVFGVLAALFALVPLAGTPIVWVPAAIVLAADERWYAAIFLLIWGGLVSTVDNVLRPILVAGRADVATLTVFIGVLGGVAAFGAIGIVAGPLVLALIIALIRFVLDSRDSDASAASR